MLWPTEANQILEKARRDAALTPRERSNAFIGLLALFEDLLRTSPVRDRQLELYRRHEDEEHRAWRAVIRRGHAAGTWGRDTGAR